MEVPTNVCLRVPARELVRGLDEVGAAMCRVMSSDEALALAEGVRDYHFVQRPALYGPRKVPQRFSACEEESIPEGSVVRTLSGRLSLELNNIFSELRRVEKDAPLSENLFFNDHLLLQYPKGEGVLGAHRDESKYRKIIVAVTLSGSALFSIHRASDTDFTIPNEVSFAEFHTTPGTAVFMVAPGYRGQGCGIRPFHSVRHVLSNRTSLVLKQKELVAC